MGRLPKEVLRKRPEHPARIVIEVELETRYKLHELAAKARMPFSLYLRELLEKEVNREGWDG